VANAVYRDRQALIEIGASQEGGIDQIVAGRSQPGHNLKSSSPQRMLTLSEKPLDKALAICYICDILTQVIDIIYSYHNWISGHVDFLNFALQAGFKLISVRWLPA
jgi:hypothetical protein